jgi:hypothetical protein
VIRTAFPRTPAPPRRTTRTLLASGEPLEGVAALKRLAGPPAPEYRIAPGQTLELLRLALADARRKSAALEGAPLARPVPRPLDLDGRGGKGGD